MVGKEVTNSCTYHLRSMAVANGHQNIMYLVKVVKKHYKTLSAVEQVMHV